MTAARPLSVMLAAALAGCSPTYDWRDAGEPPVHVQLPARAASMSRTIHIGADAVDMRMQGARVERTSFTVGVVEWPTAQQARDALPPMREQMLRNIGADPQTPARAVRVRIERPGRGAASAWVDAVEVEAGGGAAGAGATRNGPAMTMRARFAAVGRRSIQAVVLGPQIDAEQATYFFDTLRLDDAP